MKLTKQDWIGIVAIIVTIIGWQYSGTKNKNVPKITSMENSVNSQVAGAGNVTVVQNMASSSNSTQTTYFDSPALYTSSQSVSENNDSKWPYKAEINIIADKNTNLPNQLCLGVHTDVKTFGHEIFNDEPSGGFEMTWPNNSGYLCISNPSAKLKSTFLMDAKPKILITDLK